MDRCRAVANDRARRVPCPPVAPSTAISSRDTSTSPVFQVLLAYEDEDFLAPTNITPDLTLTTQAVPTRTAKFDIVINLHVEHNTLTGNIEYATSLYQQQRVA